MQTLFNGITIFLLAVGCMLAGAPGKENVCMIGHRGYSSKYVENTEEAFVAAAKHGSGGVETDVRITKDGVLVLSHDSEVEFSDGTVLTVADSTYADLSAKPLKNKFCHDNVMLCTYERYLEICRQYDLVCFIEFKGEFPEESISRAFDMAKQVYTMDKCILQSGSLDNLLKARKRFPELDIMFTFGQGDFDAGITFEQLIDLDFSIDIDYHIATKESAKLFHDAGLEYGIWTCNNIFALYYGYSLGADYIESDVF